MIIINKILEILKKPIKLIGLLKTFAKRAQTHEHGLILSGRIMSELIKPKSHPASLSDIEFKVFSQFGDDGIIQWLTNNLDIPNKTFIEFGVEDYRESNTRFLMMNDNWSGFILDGSKKNIETIINSEYFWRHDLNAKHAFITRDNINDLLDSCGLNKEVGLLHIDIDGNDYWVWKEISTISPIIVIMEYNSVFGSDRSITIPYEDTFNRTSSHFSNLYFGASLPALIDLSNKKDYAFIGCNSAGNNAYFIRRDKMNEKLTEASLKQGFVLSKFRESRDQNGALTHLSGEDRQVAIKGLPVYNTRTGKTEPF